VTVRSLIGCHQLGSVFVVFCVLHDPELDQQLVELEEWQWESPSIEQLRSWYRAARALGCSDDDRTYARTIEIAGCLSCAIK
jgi:hypothetical protein